MLKYPNSLNLLSELNVYMKNIFWAYTSVASVVVVRIKREFYSIIINNAAKPCRLDAVIDYRSST